MASTPVRKRLLFALVTLVVFFAGLELVAVGVGAWLRAHPYKAAEADPAFLAGLPEAEVVVVCAGDSWTQGFEVAEDEAYPTQLEGVLRGAHGLDARVVNLGRVAASPLQIAQRVRPWLETGRVDLLVYLGGFNPDLPEFFERSSYAGQRRGVLAGVLSRLRSYRVLSQVVTRARLRGDALLGSDDIVRNAGNGPYNAASAREGVLRMGALAQAHDTPLLLLTYAVPPVMRGQEQWVRHPGLNRDLREAAARAGLELLDTESVYDRLDVPAEQALLFGSKGWTNYVEPDLHPSPVGYGAYAEAVGEWIAGWITSG